MTNKPGIGQYYGADEQALIERIESDDYLIGESGLTDSLLSELKNTAKNTIVDSR